MSTNEDGKFQEDAVVTGTPAPHICGMKSSYATAIAIGVALGVPIGLLFDNIVMGIGIGIALGLALRLAFGPASSSPAPKDDGRGR